MHNPRNKECPRNSIGCAAYHVGACPGHGICTCPPAPSTEGKDFEPEVNEWINEGRTPEQIYGVKNFLTGAGNRMIDRLIENARREGFELGLDQQWDKKDPPTWVTRKARAQLLKEIREEVIKVTTYHSKAGEHVKNNVLSLLDKKEKGI